MLASVENRTDKPQNLRLPSSLAGWLALSTQSRAAWNPGQGSIENRVKKRVEGIAVRRVIRLDCAQLVKREAR